MGDKLSKLWGQPVIVDNRPGAGGLIGLGAIKNGAQDDHTFAFVAASTITLSPYMFKSAGVDAVRDFVPVALVAEGPMIMAVNASSPANSLADVVAMAKKNPDAFVVTSPFLYSVPHLAGEVLAKAAGVPMRAVPYTNSGAAIAAVMNNDAHVHGRTIGGTPQAHCDADTQTTRSQTSVNVTRWMMNSVPPPAYVAGHKFNTPTVDRWMEIDFFPPAAVRIHTGATDAGTGAREGNRQGGFAFMGLNLQTPETEKTTHYFWSGARSRRAGEPAVRDALLASLSITFAEDKVVVEAQQASLDRDPAVPLVMIASDAGLVHARRLVAAMIDTEAKTSKAAGGSHEAPLRERQTEEAQHEA